MPEKNKKIVLLDAYAILHRAYHALPDFTSAKGEATGALYGVSAMLLKIIPELKPDYIVACFDLPKKTYRHKIYEEYKAGRKKPDDELISQIEKSRELFRAFNIPIYEKEGYEADDILGTISEQLKKEKIDIVIASGDMDTMQLIDKKKVQVYTLKKGINSVILYDEKAVIERFGLTPKQLIDYKALRGDPSDNIKGVKGIGDKTATILIQKFGTIEEIYEKLEKDENSFLKEGIKPRVISLLKENKEEAFFSKELATIFLDVPIKFSLPKQIWETELEEEKIIEIFQELGFRSLLKRAREIFFTEDNQEKEEEISDLEFKKTAIALWVLDSNKTKTTVQEIKDITREKDFKKAQQKLLEDLKKKNLYELYEKIEIPLITVFEKMKERGIKLDVEYLKKLSKEYTKKLKTLEQKIWEQAGEEFNINSPKQLSEILFEKMDLISSGRKKTSTGMRSTKESELQKMLDVHPIIKDILEYRELKKLLSTYIDALPKMVDENSFVHTTFLQTGTATGRISSINPNLQNIPVKTEQGKKIRNAFIAQEGYELVAFDYSQIELRVAAILSKDKNLIKIFQEGNDVHSAVASRIFGVALNKVASKMRRKAKVVNFGMIYGMGINSLRQNMEDASDSEEKITRQEAQEFYDKYFENFKDLALYLEKTKEDVAKNGYTKTLFGRIRKFEGINSKLPFIRAMAERMAINAPIQGTSADILKIAMKKIDLYLEKNNLEKDIRMLLQIHDELIFEIKKEADKKHLLEIEKIMEEVLTEDKNEGIRLEANLKKGPNWGELKSFEV